MLGKESLSAIVNREVVIVSSLEGSLLDFIILGIVRESKQIFLLRGIPAGLTLDLWIILF